MIVIRSWSRLLAARCWLKFRDYLGPIESAAEYPASADSPRDGAALGGKSPRTGRRFPPPSGFSPVVIY
jgi:hypothetical protein